LKDDRKLEDFHHSLIINIIMHYAHSIAVKNIMSNPQKLW